MKVKYLYDPALKIHKYIDGEISAVEKQEFEKELDSDPALRQELCYFQSQKQELLQDYLSLKPSRPNLKPAKSNLALGRLAASLLLGFILGLGSLWLASADFSSPLDSSRSFVVHLDTNDKDKLYSTLKKAEFLLQTNPETQVQIVANHEGIELFNADNATSDEVLRLLSQYHHLEMLACRRTVERAEKEQGEVNLLPKVRIDEPAVDEVVKKMKQGWTYIKI